MRNGGDPMAFVVAGARYQYGDPAGADGYDGQFSYYIALDPTGAAGKLDVPAYRYQRILYPMLARWLALCQPALIPWTLVLVNLIALAAGTALVERLMVHFRVNRWHALIYGLYAGLLMSVRLDLSEPIAYALTIVACWAFERRRPGRAAALFALAALAKETTLIFAAAYGLYLLSKEGRRMALRFGLAAAGPFAAWQIFLWQWLGSPGVGSGGAMATPFEIIPLMGLWGLEQSARRRFCSMSPSWVPSSSCPLCGRSGLPAGKSCAAGGILLPWLFFSMRPFSSFYPTVAGASFWPCCDCQLD